MLVAKCELKVSRKNKAVDRKAMADTEGFEPSKPRKELASLAGRWFQPLTHVSVAMQHD